MVSERRTLLDPIDIPIQLRKKNQVIRHLRGLRSLLHFQDF